ncbi:MAG: hypothetical protein H6577_06285 [Lewinellaceae bacterium]|nr:hypothetical protein [Saprospiraceae bacterium]MCB9337716.1 hypothetical protein [Lewinellaceae bacterium]
MKKDIPQYKVADLAIAIVPREDHGILDQEMWDVFVVNLKEDPIENVLVNSRGYGEIEGEQMRTTILRHFFNEIGPQEAILIEPIQTKLFDIANEYWVSFTYDGYMYDKKYVFVRGSITEENFTTIPFLERKGVMIK